MTAADIWPFLETVLKVGIGGAMALAAMWLHQRRHQYSVASSSTTNRRLALLEEISTAVGTVNHCFARYSALVIESTRFGKNWPSARRLELERVNTELVAEFRKLADAEAKLLMLGEKTMEKTLRLYGARIALFRKQVYIGRQDITEQEIADLKTSILALREKFYELLSRRYDRLLVA
jgi:hypothetical protein